MSKTAKARVIEGDIFSEYKVTEKVLVRDSMLWGLLRSVSDLCVSP